jgi:hypothetical protein
MSLEVAMPEVPSFEMNYGMRANTMRIEMSRRGLLNATIGLIGKGAPRRRASTAAPAPRRRSPSTASPRRRRNQEGRRPTGSRSSARRSLIRTISTRSKPSTPTAKSKTPTPAWRPGPATSPCAFGDLALLDAATGRTPVELTFGWTFGDFALLFTYQRVFLPRPKRPITGPERHPGQLRLAGVGRAGAIMTALLTNDVTSYKPSIG